MPYVVDASVAVKWFVTEQDHGRGSRPFGERDRPLYAGCSCSTEASNVLRKKCKAGIITVDDARERFDSTAEIFSARLTRRLDYRDGIRKSPARSIIRSTTCIYLEAPRSTMCSLSLQIAGLPKTLPNTTLLVHVTVCCPTGEPRHDTTSPSTRTRSRFATWRGSLPRRRSRRMRSAGTRRSIFRST